MKDFIHIYNNDDKIGHDWNAWAAQFSEQKAETNVMTPIKMPWCVIGLAIWAFNSHSSADGLKGFLRSAGF